MGGGGGAPRKRRPMFDKSFYLPDEYKSPDFLHFSRRVAGDQVRDWGHKQRRLRGSNKSLSRTYTHPTGSKSRASIAACE